METLAWDPTYLPGVALDLARLDQSPSVFKTHQRGLKTLASAAAWQKRSDLDEPIAAQLRILNAATQAGCSLGPDDLAQLTESSESTRSKMETGERVVRAATDRRELACPAASTTIRIDQEKLDRLMRVVGELLVARGAIRRAILAIRFPDAVAEASARSTALFEQIVDRYSDLNGTAGTAAHHKVQELKLNYTMAHEPDVHQSAIESTANIAAANDAFLMAGNGGMGYDLIVGCLAGLMVSTATARPTGPVAPKSQPSAPRDEWSL